MKNAPLSVAQAQKLLGIEEIGTYPTPEGSVHFWWENGKVIAECYNRQYDDSSKYVYDSLNDALYGVADAFY